MEKHLKFEDYANDLDIPKEWKDMTWKGDITPSFGYLHHRIWVDHPDPKESEYGEPKEGETYYRFNITKDVWDDQENVFATDDFNEVVKYMESLNGLTWDQYANDLYIPDEWEVSSYGNDACPSFTYKGYQIFHDHPDPSEREIPEWKRFHVILQDKYGQPTGWCFDTDDFNEVLETVKIPFHKQVEKFINTDELDFFDWPADLNIPKEWKETSWIQDLTPSYEFNGWVIHIDHPDPEKSALKKEFGSKDDGSAFERFRIWPSHDEEVLENTLETNNFDEVIKFVSKKQS